MPTFDGIDLDDLSDNADGPTAHVSPAGSKRPPIRNDDMPKFDGVDIGDL
jgi:hypothetical protein